MPSNHRPISVKCTCSKFKLCKVYKTEWFWQEKAPFRNKFGHLRQKLATFHFGNRNWLFLTRNWPFLTRNWLFLTWKWPFLTQNWPFQSEDEYFIFWNSNTKLCLYFEPSKILIKNDHFKSKIAFFQNIMYYFRCSPRRLEGKSRHFIAASWLSTFVFIKGKWYTAVQIFFTYTWVKYIQDPSIYKPCMCHL